MSGRKLIEFKGSLSERVREVFQSDLLEASKLGGELSNKLGEVKLLLLEMEMSKSLVDSGSFKVGIVSDGNNEEQKNDQQSIADLIEKLEREIIDHEWPGKVVTYGEKVSLGYVPELKRNVIIYQIGFEYI